MHKKTIKDSRHRLWYATNSL